MTKVRLALAGLLAAVFTVVSAGSASAAATVETFPVSFTLSSATCPNLPDGTVITGTGVGKSITVEGTRAIFNVTHDQGTATDQDGNRYVFSYSNQLRAHATPDPDVFAGMMTDHFSLSGPGAARLNNGFVAEFETDFNTFFSFPHVISSHGDPLNFPEGTVACDPL
jgi:hypothetical protein